jgi:predicted nucleotidyltransferase
MDAKLSECRFPDLGEFYDEALRQAVVHILERYDPIAIIVTGTILRGSPSPTSDLDMWVLWDDPRRQRAQKVFNGVPTEIFVNPPSRVQRYFNEETAAGKPVTAHMVSTGFVVYEGDPVLREIREQAAQVLADGPEVNEEGLKAKRYRAATLLEDGLDILAEDAAGSAMLMANAMDILVRAQYVASGRWQPRDKEVVALLHEVDPEFARHVRDFYMAASVGEKASAAREAFQRAIGEVGFFEWESALSEA